MADNDSSKSQLVAFHMQEIRCDFIFRIIELTLMCPQMFGFCDIAFVLRWQEFDNDAVTDRKCHPKST